MYNKRKIKRQTMQTSTKITGFKKLWLIFILAFMSAVAPLSTDMYLPALAHVQEAFATSEFFTQLSLASFFIAFALGQLIYGPLSDFFGRKKPLIIGIALFMSASLGCVMVDNVAHFIALRFLEALGGCAGVVIARAIVNDLFELHEAAAVFALMMVVSSLAPMLSPTFGGFLLQLFSWESIFISLFLLGIALLLFVIFTLKESHKPHKESFDFKAITSRYKDVLKDRPFIIYTLSSGFAMGAMFAYITGSSFVFIKYFGLHEQVYALVFGANSLGFMILSIINARLVFWCQPRTLLGLGLALMCAFSLLLMFFDSFWLFEGALFCAIACLGLIAPNAVTLAMSRFKEHSGTASAMLGTTQFALAGIISFGVGAYGANTPWQLGLVIFACSALAAGFFFAFIKKSA